MIQFVSGNTTVGVEYAGTELKLAMIARWWWWWRWGTDVLIGELTRDINQCIADTLVGID